MEGKGEFALQRAVAIGQAGSDGEEGGSERGLSDGNNLSAMSTCFQKRDRSLSIKNKIGSRRLR